MPAHWQGVGDVIRPDTTLLFYAEKPDGEIEGTGQNRQTYHCQAFCADVLSAICRMEQLLDSISIGLLAKDG